MLPDGGRKRPASPNLPEDDNAIVPGVTLSLTPQEVALFDILMEVIVKRGLESVLRVAGGWVRDKILGGPSHDIDIAINDRMGKAFAEELVAYMHESGRASEVGSIGVIKSNPDQSKHLETATVRVMGFEIDFVNLRAEEYTDTRIPVMRIGTALEDAQRRDLTINALFYNINKQAVEDYTGKGVADLQARIVRTPLPPLQTMIDDPLRALRAIRFATRLGFTLDPTLAETISSKEVTDVLASKVSRERVMAELNGMLNGPRPANALSLLHSLSLFPVVFQPPDLPDLPSHWPDIAHGIVQHCVKLSAPLVSQLLGKPSSTGATEPAIHALCKEERRLLFLSAALAPLRGFSVAKGKKALPAPEHVVRTSLKGTIKDAQDTATVLLAAELLAAAAQRLFPADGAAVGEAAELELKVQVGECLKKSGEMWRVALVLALCERLCQAGSSMRDTADGDKTEAEKAEEQMAALERKVCAEWCVEGAWNLRALVSGQEICELVGLDIKTAGKRIGEIHREMAVWVLQQPRPLEVSKADCEAWIKATHASSA